MSGASAPCDFAVKVAAPGVHETPWISVMPGVTVLTGRNNVGKSRLLKLIAQLPQQVTQNTVQTHAGMQLRQGGVTITIQLGPGESTVQRYSIDEGGQTVFQLGYGTHANGKLIVLNDAPQQSPQYALNLQTGFDNGHVRFDYLAQWLPKSQLFLDAAPRMQYVVSERSVPSIVSAKAESVPKLDGSNLVQVLYYHSTRRTPEFAELEQIVHNLFQEIGAVLTPGTSDGRVTVHLRDRFAQADIPLDDAGTGVKQALFFIAMVLFSPPGRIFLIDEPHVYLHAGAEHALADFLREHDEHSYVIATHSPVFIAAIEPDSSWLVTRDSDGTAIKSVFRGPVQHSRVLRELGVRPADLTLHRKVLFVEGSDADIYPELLRKVGLDVNAADCSVLALPGHGVTSDLRQVLERFVADLQEVLNLDWLICLDGDQAGGSPPSDQIAFLPVPELEDLLLRSPAAVLEGLQAASEGSSPERDPAAAWSVEKVEKFIADVRKRKPENKGSKVLADLAQAMGLPPYRKTLHNPDIARRMPTESVGDLRGLLGPFLAAGEAPPSQPLPAPDTEAFARGVGSG